MIIFSLRTDKTINTLYKFTSTHIFLLLNNFDYNKKTIVLWFLNVVLFYLASMSAYGIQVCLKKWCICTTSVKRLCWLIDFFRLKVKDNFDCISKKDHLKFILNHKTEFLQKTTFIWEVLKTFALQDGCLDERKKISRWVYFLIQWLVFAIIVVICSRFIFNKNSLTQCSVRLIYLVHSQQY